MNSAAPVRSLRSRAPRIASTLILLGILGSAAPAGAADFYWDADGDTSAATGNTDSGTNQWSSGATYLNWRAGGATGALQSWGAADATTATAVFGGDLAGSVLVLGYYGLSANGLRFERSGYTLSSGPIALVGATPTITSSSGVGATISSELTGGNGLIKAGAGQLTLTSANTYTGATTINGGTLYLSNLSGTGVLNGTTSVVVNAGGTLYLQSAERINNAASLGIDGGTLQLASSGTETVGAVTLGNSGRISTGTLTSNTGFELRSGTVDGTLAGSGTLTKTTAGTVTFTGQNTFTGKTTVSEGTLLLEYLGYSGYKNRALRNTSAVEIAAGATLQLAYTGDQINDTARVTIDGGTFHLGTFYETVAGVTLDNGGVIRNGQLTSTSAFDLRSGTVIAGLAGSAGLNKTTGATVTLNQQLNTPYTYTGATAITGGTLIVNGSASGSTAEANRVTIGGGARLAGAGSIARPTTVMTGGSIAPGDPTAGLGTLTTGSETWEDGSFAAFRLGNTAADRLAIGGTLTAGHATVVLTSFGLVTSTLTDSTWTLASTTGEITGLANLLLDTSALGAVDGRFSLGLSSNNANLLLSYSTVPEPATGALLFGAAALVAARRIRRRRRA